LAIDHVYGGIIFLKYFYILIASPRTDCKIISIKKLKWIFKNILLMLMAFLCLQNGGNSPHKKNIWLHQLMFILIFSKVCITNLRDHDLAIIVV
jgi:hypothetical protein